MHCSSFLSLFVFVFIFINTEKTWGLMKYFASTVGGLSLIELQYFVSLLALIVFFALMFGVYNWASLVTNKALLQKLIIILMAFGTFQAVMTIYCIITFFVSFSDVDWEVNTHTHNIL
jgi:hypothetical protein